MSESVSEWEVGAWEECKWVCAPGNGWESIYMNVCVGGRECV